MEVRPFLLLIVVCVVGCSLLDEPISSSGSLSLTFSTDTVAFDTLLTERRSPTQRLSIYNPNEAAIRISRIALAGGDLSDYSLIVNGRQSPVLTDEVLNAGDSLLVLVEIKVSAQNRDLPYAVQDQIEVSWNGNQQDIILLAYGQDGIRPEAQLICDTFWSNQRPYILSDTLVVGPGCELVIEKGAHLYFENDAALFVQGTLTAVGDTASKILFTSTRFDSGYDQVPGQWNGIYFLEGSTGSRLSFVEISNAQIGIRAGTPDDDNVPDVVLENTSIYNMSFAGILAFSSDLLASNTLIYNCGTYLVGNFAGGAYQYRHCTFSNHLSFFNSSEPYVQFSDNIVLSDGQLLSEDLTLEISNSILWGTGENELLISEGGGAQLAISLRANIIRTAETIDQNYTSLDFNFPGFTAAYDLDTLAFAKDKGVELGIRTDILGHPRDTLPDIGAFERIEN